MGRKIDPQGRCFCRPELRSQPKKQRTNPDYCPECGLKVRGAGHCDGFQHKKRIIHIAQETRQDVRREKPTIYKRP